MSCITEKAIRDRLQTQVFGKNLQVASVLPSTNDTAKVLAAAGAAEGTVVVADRQTAGRGRRGRTFLSPTGGVYLSMILRPTAPLDAGMVTCCAAVAVTRAIGRFTDLPVGIKWVNDLLIRDRKVCGILAEGGLNPSTGDLSYVVLGIGVNVERVDFPADLAAIATSLEAEGATVDRAALIAAVLEEWEALYTTLYSGEFMEEYRRLSVVLGRSLTVMQGDKTFCAVAEWVDDNGHLVVRTDTERLTLHSGEVSVRL